MNLPAGMLSQHIAVLGKTGSGKSSVMRYLVEGLLDDKKPVCIIDPKGDWWGLKSSANGKSAGYSVVIFGGEHADVPINAHSGGHIAELVSTGNRPCIIDLGGWMPGERTRFFVDFAAALFRHTRGQRYLVVDEVHNFAPQGKVMDPDSGKMLHWANRLASEGRGKGLVILAASQRPQKVHKDFLTSCETLIAMRVVHELDRNAIKGWIDGCPDKDKGREVLSTIANIPRGNGWVWSPEIHFGPKLIAFPMFKTYDSFAPQHSEHAAKLKGWASVDLDEVKDRLALVVEEAKANDPAELKKRIAALEKELKAKPTASPVTETKIELVEVPVFTPEALETLRRFDAWSQDMAKAFREFGAKLQKDINDATARIKAALPAPSKPAPRPAGTLTTSSKNAISMPSSGPGVALPAGERAVLIVVAQYPEGANSTQISIITGYKRQTRDAYLQRLRGRGYVDGNGSCVRATQEGINALGWDYQPLPTGDELKRHWLDRLPKGEAQILKIVLGDYPNSSVRDAISEATGFARQTRDAYIQRLAAKKLVVATWPGQIGASEVFFE